MVGAQDVPQLFVGRCIGHRDGLDGGAGLRGVVQEGFGEQVLAADEMVVQGSQRHVGPGGNGLQISFPFAVSAANPPDPGVMRIEGNTLSYLRSIRPKERLSFSVTGFGAGGAQDYDFRVTDTATGAGVRVQGDQPLTQVNTFSIDKVQAVEPYIAVDIEPGQEKRWTYRYTYTAPKS